MMMFTHRPKRTPISNVFIILVLGLITAGIVSAQSVHGDPVDLNFEVINATTGQPGSIDRLVLQYSSHRLNAVLDINPSGSSFEVPDAPISDRGKYIITAWHKNVPYYWSLRGRDLKEKTITLNVFDVINSLDSVTIVGMDVLLKKTESLLEMEFLLQVNNSAQPQATVMADRPVLISLPAGASSVSLSYGNGPEKEEMQISHLSGGKAALSVPLTTGRNPMRLKAKAPWTDGMDLPIGSNVTISSWSLMATPTTLDIQSFDLVASPDSGQNNHLRFKGPSLEAGRDFELRIKNLQASDQKEDLFTQESDSEDTSEAKVAKNEEDKDKSFPFVVFIPILVIVLVVVARKRR